ncbi:MAG: hypothetical protein GY749_19010 [Desulfobacteraceae bacterium]|nr:hypothetical protein [Desulfobacteraceae bacterium]
MCRHSGHKGKTAENLNVDRKTLCRKLKKYGITFEGVQNEILALSTAKISFWTPSKVSTGK